MDFSQEYEKLKTIKALDLKEELNRQYNELREKAHLLTVIDLINYLEESIENSSIIKKGDSLSFYRKYESRIDDYCLRFNIGNEYKEIWDSDLEDDITKNVTPKLYLSHDNELNFSMELINIKMFEHKNDHVVLIVDENLSANLYFYLLNDRLQATLNYHQLNSVLANKTDNQNKPKL